MNNKNGWNSFPRNILIVVYTVTVMWWVNFSQMSLKCSGCHTLETLRNSNIGQPLPSDMQEQDEDPPHPQFQEDQDEPLEDDDN